MEAGTSDPGGVERHCPSNGVRKATAHQETRWAWTELQGISLQHKEKKKKDSFTMRVFTHWNRLLRDVYVVSILGNIKKHNWTQL